MKILIDMNLSPSWVSVLEEAGHTASHWSTIGSLNAPNNAKGMEHSAQHEAKVQLLHLIIFLLKCLVANIKMLKKGK